MNILVGTDPEVFARMHGELVSAHGLVKGSKEEPFPVDKGAVQVDGMALEFNIDPSATPDEFSANIAAVMAQLEGMIGEHTIDISPVAEFGAEYIKQQPPEAQELGCDPDFNAWSGEENTPPDVDAPFRTGAGHVHVGWTEGVMIDDPVHLMTCHKIIRQLDFYLGIPSVIYDTCTKRRELYGKAGAFRPKSYGAEYRVLSNQWLKTDDSIKWVFRAVQRALYDLSCGHDLTDRYGDIQTIINNSDVELANQIIEAEGLEVPNVSN